MNPFAVSRTIEARYKAYLRSNFRAADPELAERFSQTLERKDVLVREPFVSLATPFVPGESLDALGAEPVIAERLKTSAFTTPPHLPYKHQSDAYRRIAAGEPTIVATGTGSGKTESFLMPILDHCYRERDRPGPKALFLYPMNALAIDQNKRIGDYVRGTGISYGVYTGSTERGGGDPPSNAPGELRYRREEFETRPPDLFLTNYQMLEYLLLRDDGRKIFARHAIRFIVLDEVHAYRGALGTDVALLLRRLRSALHGLAPAAPPIVFVGTSATLQKREDGDADPAAGVAAFFSQLTGLSVGPDAVITEQRRQPEPVGDAPFAAPDLRSLTLMTSTRQIPRHSARKRAVDGNARRRRRAATFRRLGARPVLAARAAAAACARRRRRPPLARAGALRRPGGRLAPRDRGRARRRRGSAE